MRRNAREAVSRVFLLRLMVLLLCMVSVSLCAQTPEPSVASTLPESTSPKPALTEQNEKAKRNQQEKLPLLPPNKTKPNKTKKPSKKTFKPSEEISEDSPVPFPVDI